jgi:aminopeptidase N
MIFANSVTSMVIKGDVACALVVAHEFAHSWTVNLITTRPMRIFG